MIGNSFPRAERPLIVSNVRPVGSAETLDIRIAPEGTIAEIGAVLAPGDAHVIDGGGGFVSPGWADLHAHIWYGGTDISIRPAEAGVQRGVTTIVDAGSAGEANFHGFREYVAEPASENVYAFLNLGSIGLVACNRVSELAGMASIDIDRIVACIEANRDVIRGLKVRASAVITGGWDLAPVKLAKKLGKILKLPIMVHVGEPPPLYDDVLAVLGEGDIVTHCFNGKVGGSILEDEDLFALAEDAARRGIVLDVGHGGASFSFDVARGALGRGLAPQTISTDLHNRSMDQSVWDMATTLSKLLEMGMAFEDIVHAATIAPRRAIGLPADDLLAVGKPAELTVFDLADTHLEVRDAHGAVSVLHKTFEPRHAILGASAIPAARYQPADGASAKACPHCGWPL